MPRDILRWPSHPQTTPPPLLALRSSYTFILATICIAIFTDIFLYGIIVPVIPFALTHRASIPLDSVQHWVSILLAVYGASLLAASPVCGWLADHTKSRRLPLLVGLGALEGSTVLLCVGRGIACLVVGRMLQGIAAAIVWTVGLALLVDTVGHVKVGQAMGYVAMSMSIAVLVAPLLGGVVYARAGYYAVFYMAFGLIGVDIVLRVLLVEKKIAKQWDFGGDEDAGADESGEKTVSDNTLESGPMQSGPLKNPPRQAELVNRSIPRLPEQASTNARSSIVFLLTSRRLLAALFCTFAQSTLLTSWDAVLPLYTHRIFGWSSIGAGLIFFPLVVPSFLSPVFGFWSDRKGPRGPTSLGFLFAVPFLVLLRLVDHNGIRQIVLMCALLALLGLALSMAMTPLLAEITYVVGHKEKSHPGAFGGKGAYATAYGIFNVAFAGGMLIGPLWGGFVTQGSGWGTMCWTLAVLSVAGAVVSFLWIGGWVGKSGRRARKQEVEGRNPVRSEV
ncbi:hypothetical protein ACLMJK_008587 [Lecanora helva]